MTETKTPKAPIDEFEAHRRAEMRVCEQLFEVGDSDPDLKAQLLAEIAAHREAQQALDPERYEQLREQAMAALRRQMKRWP